MLSLTSLFRGRVKGSRAGHDSENWSYEDFRAPVRSHEMQWYATHDASHTMKWRHDGRAMIQRAAFSAFVPFTHNNKNR